MQQTCRQTPAGIADTKEEEAPIRQIAAPAVPRRSGIDRQAVPCSWMDA